MVRAQGQETGTIRAACGMSDGINTMIEYNDTLESQLGTMVINAEDEEDEGTMKSKSIFHYNKVQSFNFKAGTANVIPVSCQRPQGTNF